MIERRWLVFRVLFFFLLGYDVYCSQERAIHYDHEFNVSHFDILNGDIPFIYQWFYPNRATMVISANLIFFLSLLCAIGAWYKGSLTILFITYTLRYMGSRLDSYQHHFFLCILLGTLILMDRDGKPECMIRYIRYEVAIVYGFAAYTKTMWYFLSGEILKRQLYNRMTFDTVTLLSNYLSVSENFIWACAAISVVFVESSLAIGWIIERPKYPLLIWLPGIALHIMVEMVGFQVLFFSYYMFILYVWYLPDFFVNGLYSVIKGITL